MYKFVKIKLNQDSDAFKDWFFYPQTKEDVSEHWDKYAKQCLDNPNIAESLKQKRLDTFNDNENMLLAAGGQCISIVPFNICTIIDTKFNDILQYPK